MISIYLSMKYFSSCQFNQVFHIVLKWGPGWGKVLKMVHASVWKLFLYEGRPVCSVWFGLWGRFGIQKQVGEDQVGSLFFQKHCFGSEELGAPETTSHHSFNLRRRARLRGSKPILIGSSVWLECGLKLRSHATHPRHPARRPLPHCFNKSGLQDSDTSFVLWFSFQFLLHTPIHLIPIYSSQIEAPKVTIIKQKFSPVWMFSLVTVDVICTLKCQKMTSL